MAMETPRSTTAESHGFDLRDEVGCQHLGGTSELAVVAPLKAAFVDVREPVTYATRLRMLLRTLHEIGKRRLERGEDAAIIGPVERLRIIHHVRWTITDDEQNMSMAVVFDSALEPYARLLRQEAGPILDVILCHCEGYEGHRGYHAFADFVRRHQVANEFLGASVHQLTVDDQIYLKELEAQQREQPEPAAVDRWAARHHVTGPDTSGGPRPAPGEVLSQAARALAALYPLDEFFPEPAPDDANAAAKTLERRLFHSMVLSLLPGAAGLQIPEESPLRRRYHRELSWFMQMVKSAAMSAAQAQPDNTSTPDPAGLSRLVQGDILSGYRGITHGCLMLLRFGDSAGARAFLRDLQPELTSADAAGGIVGRDAVQREEALNLGLTCEGLRTLGVTEEELSAFPRDFREGMAARASLLGDLGPNHPTNWEPPGDLEGRELALASIDATLLIQTKSRREQPVWNWSPEHPLHARAMELQQRLEAGGGKVLAFEPAYRRRVDGKVYEHFGYRDGISQPQVFPTGTARDQVAPGELLLGHRNSSGDASPVAPASMLYNGSFLVVRKLAQDVAAFDQVVERNARANGIAAEEIRAKMMGRTSAGTPLVEGVTGNEGNDFDFTGDPDGLRCPLESHIRRANPRPEDATEATRIPRIARRALSYGPPGRDASARGLVFLAYNASIAEQFERIQRWVGGANSTGRYSAHGDPVAGVSLGGRERSFCYPTATDPVRVKLGDRPLVRLLWGLYVFVPSLDAVERLAVTGAVDKPYPKANVARGERLIRRFGALADMDADKDTGRGAAITRWKMLLEDLSTRKYREDVWAAIRALHGGVLQTPYGVLVGSTAGVMQVFRDAGKHYSVRDYLERMRGTIGELYLGLDPAAGPRYGEDSAVTNAWINGFSRQRAFTDSHEIATGTLNGMLLEQGATRYGLIRLRDLADEVLGRLTVKWFGIPETGAIQVGAQAGTAANTPDDLVLAGSNIFPPHPIDSITRAGTRRCPRLTAAIGAGLAGTAEPPESSGTTLSGELRKSGMPIDGIARTVAGAAMGFVAPTLTSFMSVLHTWITGGDLWRFQQSLRAAGDGAAADLQGVQRILYAGLIRAMLERPSPALLHRTAAQDTSLGDALLKEDQRVVLGLESACLEQLDRRVADDVANRAVLFGGNYGDDGGEYTTAHACPGQEMAIGTLLGITSALLALDGTLRPRGRLALTLNEREDGSVG